MFCGRALVICYEYTYEQLDRIGEAFRGSLSYLMQALKSNRANEYLHGSAVEPVFEPLRDSVMNLFDLSNKVCLVAVP